MPDRPILLTGFEPYGGRARNPSAEVAAALDGRVVDGRRVVGRTLPVSFGRVGGEIGRLVADHAPAAVLALGLGPGEAAIRLERVGVNIADFPLADNDGLRVSDVPVLDGGSPAHLATLPLQAIRAALLEAGIPARLSDTAGTYLCNACLYLLLEAGRATGMRAGFLHLPYLPEQAADLLAAGESREAAPSMELARMVAAADIAVRITSQALKP